MAYYRVEVTAGAYSWAVEDTDPPDYGLADPLTVGWALDTSGELMPHPQPVEATFRVVVASMADVAGLGIGQPVTIRVWAWPPGTLNPDFAPASVEYPPIVVFRGRTGQLTAKPHKLGMVLTIPCVDYTVDLAETDAGDADWPAEGSAARITRISNEAGLPTPLSVGVATWQNFAARTASRDNARNLLIRHLTAMVTELDATYTTEWKSRLYLVPWFGNDGMDALDVDTPDPLEPFVLVEVPRRTPGSVSYRLTGGGGVSKPSLPGVFALLSTGKWGVDVQPDAANVSRILDAADVDFDANWLLFKRDRPDVVTVTGQFTDGTKTTELRAPDAIPIRLSIDTDLTNKQAADAVAWFNLPEGDTDQWKADAFTFYATSDPAKLLYPRPMFVDVETPAAQLEPAVIDGIPVAQSPTGLDWYAGQVAAAVFTLARGKYTASVALRRNLPRPEAGGITPADLIAEHGADLVANTGFEANVVGYTGVNAALAQSAAQAHTGTKSMSVTAAAAGNASAVDSGSGAGGFVVVPLMKYRVRVWSRAAAVSRLIQVRVDWWTAAGVFLSQSVGTAVADAAGGWTEVPELFQAPATAARARRQAIVVGANAAEVHYLDDFTVKLTPYAAITPADLDPRFSPYDYRIVRTPDA